ncbi:hypothetical protein E1301_Tti003310 [Triplophysa tibetana]|uniref:C2H2-type domain-containing protein n=1 Tax=Triplophysa tibetana TaxID=1572043 RepID=A0A5A9PP37_9TELE|nr:hypothetical protein E1301_Tti003310 [Triplophysa tibetana]
MLLSLEYTGHGGQRPFQCQYCPYSASQKGNLKTHVLCVHRMPFDNSQYPDRRFKRSRIDSDVTGSSEDGNPLSLAQGITAEEKRSAATIPRQLEGKERRRGDVERTLHEHDTTSGHLPTTDVQGWSQRTEGCGSCLFEGADVNACTCLEVLSVYFLNRASSSKRTRWSHHSERSSSLTQIPDGRQASASCGSDNQRSVKAVNIQQTKRIEHITHRLQSLMMSGHILTPKCKKKLSMLLSEGVSWPGAPLQMLAVALSALTNDVIDGQNKKEHTHSPIYTLMFRRCECALCLMRDVVSVSPHNVAAEGDWSPRDAPQRAGRLGLSSPHQRSNLLPHLKRDVFVISSSSDSDRTLLVVFQYAKSVSNKQGLRGYQLQRQHERDVYQLADLVHLHGHGTAIPLSQLKESTFAQCGLERHTKREKNAERETEKRWSSDCWANVQRRKNTEGNKAVLAHFVIMYITDGYNAKQFRFDSCMPRKTFLQLGSHFVQATR